MASFIYCLSSFNTSLHHSKWFVLLLISTASIGLNQLCLAQSELYNSNGNTLEVSYDKTVYLVFDAPVLSADRGSRQLLAQKDIAAPNILKIKSSVRDIPPTNLHVVTQSGKVYAFLVNYKESPVRHTHYFKEDNALLHSGHNLRTFEFFSTQLLEQSSKFILKSKTDKLSLWLFGVYEIGDMIYLKVGLHNAGSLSFNPGSISFHIKDRKVANRTTIREEVLIPHYSTTSTLQNLPGAQYRLFVFAFSRFGLDKSKLLEMEVRESQGDRNPILKIKGKHLQKAGRISLVQP